MRRAIPIPVDWILRDPQIEKLFPPLAPAAYTELKENIKEAGLITAVSVEKLEHNSYRLLDGYHRHRIHQELSLPEIDCDICENAIEINTAIFSNLHRRQLTSDEQQAIREHETQWTRQIRQKLCPEILHLLQTCAVQPLLPKQFWWKLAASKVDEQRKFARSLKDALDHYAREQSGAAAAGDGGLTPQQVRHLTRKCATLQEEVETLKQDNTFLEAMLQSPEEQSRIDVPLPNPTAPGANPVLDAQHCHAVVTLLDYMNAQIDCLLRQFDQHRVHPDQVPEPFRAGVRTLLGNAQRLAGLVTADTPHDDSSAHSL